MKKSPFYIPLLVLWFASTALAGGCRRAAIVPQDTVQYTPLVLNSPGEPTLPPELQATPKFTETTATQEPASSPLLAGLDGLSFERFIEESFKIILLRDPEWVTSEGIAALLGTDNSRLTDISEGYRQESLEIYRQVLDMLSTYDRDSLTPEQQITYDSYSWYLDDMLRLGEFRFHEYPVNPIITGIQYQLLYLFTDLHPLTNLQDVQDYINRLRQVDWKFDQLIENLQISQTNGIYPPQVAIQASLGSIQSIASSPVEATPFYRTLQEKLGNIDGLSEPDRQSLLEDAYKAIEESVLPAYQDLAGYLSVMQTVDTATGGVWQHPDGEAYYQAALRHHTTTGLGADEIHQLGLEALERVRDEMRLRFDALGYPQDENLVQHFQRLAADSGYAQGGDILQGYQELIAQAGQNLENAFDRQPAAGLEVRSGPGSTAFYVSPAVDGSRPGVFYAPVAGQEPRFKMPTLAYHEGVPGHHFQISLGQELDLPLFRRLVVFTGYTEGWALYAERLAEELGWYAEDPYGDLGRLQMEAFRAARLVVDTGLHARKWTFNQAVDFLVENTGLERGFIQNEVVRYLVWPGQAASYAVGYFKLLELRQEAMESLGDEFDLKEFHQAVIGSGSLPLEMLERVVDEMETLASLKQISDYPLYVMHYQGDYGFSSFLPKDVQSEANEQSSPWLVDYSLAGETAWACTGFASLNPWGDRLMGRNFDWLLHPALLLFTDPPDGYASVSMVDMHYLGFDGPVADADRHQLLAAPYLPFDGMNERGLAVGMMAVPEADSGYNPNRMSISDLGLIRLLLDYAANVDEAVALMAEYNIDFGGGPPLHYFLADPSGNSAVVEFVGGEMRVLPNQDDWQVSTNFLVSEEQPQGANSSCWRYNTAYAALEKSEGVISSQAAMELLESVSQEGQYGTRWSMIYNLSTLDISLVMGRDFSQVFSFHLDE